MKTITKSLCIVACTIALIFVVYISREKISPLVSPFLQKISYMLGYGVPCKQPIEYSIATLDARFGLDRQTFLKDIDTAQNVWSKIAGKKLFQYSAEGELKINLIFDNRQKATIDMANIGTTIRDKQVTYDDLKRKYDMLNLTYSQNKSALQSQISKYNTLKTSYQDKVAYWNAKGGANKQTFATMEQERTNLNAQVEVVNALERDINALAGEINSTVANLNEAARNVNVDVRKYNTVGASTGESFDEGQYISDQNGTSINIYQYENKDKLIRVLAHEFGHALGMNHIDDAKSLMYKINSGSGLTPTLGDIEQLKQVCEIK